jgi:hypothetical protein
VATADNDQLRSLGRQLGEYVARQGGILPAPAALQGVVADLTAGQSDLQAPLRDLVSRQSFAALLPHARSSGGLIQRDALIQEISRVYHPDVLIFIEQVLNGFLDSKGGIAVSLSQSISIQESSPNYQSSQQVGPDHKTNATSIDVSEDKLLPMGSPALRSATSFNPLNKPTNAPHEKIPFTPNILYPLGAVALTALFVAFASSINPSSETIETDKGSDKGSEASLEVQELSAKLVQNEADLKNARLVCELDNIANRFKSLSSEASSLKALEVKGQADGGAKMALERISKIKQPGKNEYWEDCSVGVGYQYYDNASWEASGFKTTIFATAKKDCKSPALKLELAADSGYKKIIFSKWVLFSPSADTGIAQSVPFEVPASILNGLDGVWHQVASVACNHSS